MPIFYAKICQPGPLRPASFFFYKLRYMKMLNRLHCRGRRQNAYILHISCCFIHAVVINCLFVVVVVTSCFFIHVVVISYWFIDVLLLFITGSNPGSAPNFWLCPTLVYI